MENHNITGEFLVKTSTEEFSVPNRHKWWKIEIFRERKSWINRKYRLQNQIASERRKCCVRWDQKRVVYCEFLKFGETVNAVRYRQRTINLNHALITKRLEQVWRCGKIILLLDNVPIHIKKLKNLNRGCGTSSSVFTGHCFFGLSLPNNGARISYAALFKFWREK